MFCLYRAAFTVPEAVNALSTESPTDTPGESMSIWAGTSTRPAIAAALDAYRPTGHARSAQPTGPRHPVRQWTRPQPARHNRPGSRTRPGAPSAPRCSPNRTNWTGCARPSRPGWATTSRSRSGIGTRGWAGPARWRSSTWSVLVFRGFPRRASGLTGGAGVWKPDPELAAGLLPSGDTHGDRGNEDRRVTRPVVRAGPGPVWAVRRA